MKKLLNNVRTQSEFEFLIHYRKPSSLKVVEYLLRIYQSIYFVFFLFS